ncbi:MAG: T9SS type A sorting domain-containing protein [Bacteroidales bacterium]|nr:T9SS type A sorting domain-containing protein [Bacteroidales bacterium]
MKKTLLTLALLLGTASLFAQVGMGLNDQQLQKKAVSKIDRQSVKTEKKVNLSTKGEAEVICDFSDPAAYTFGTNPGHTVTGFAWNLQADTLTAFGPQGDRLNSWLEITDSDGNLASDGWWIFNPSRGYENQTFGNGFAYLDLLTIRDNGLNSGSMDAYIKLTTPIYANGTTGIDIYINQALMRFNSERYFIEWSNDETFATYDSLEFNVRGLEMNSNDSFFGNKRLTLPNGTPNANAIGATADQPTYIRLRYTAPASPLQPHSYFWFVDDIVYQESPANRVELIKSEYCTGAYHYIPSVITPDTVVFVANVENTGATEIYDAVLTNTFYSVEVAQEEGAEDVYTQVGVNVGEADTLLNTTVTIVESENGSDVVYAARRAVELFSASSPLPSETPGIYASISSIQSSVFDEPYSLGDTTYFYVEDAAADLNGSYRWSRARNILVEEWSSWKYGFIYEQGTTWLTDDAAWNREGYEVCLPYVADYTSTDLFLNGVEVTPALDSCAAGAQIKAKLRKFNMEFVSADDLVEEVFDAWDVPVESEVYELQSSDLNNGLCSDPDYLDVIGGDELKSIYLPFKNSVELEPGEIYYACYRLVANGRFMIGADTPRYPNSFGPGNNYYQSLMLIFTPGLPASSNYAWGGSIYWSEYADGKTPLIKMVIGDATTRSLAEQATVTSSLNAYPNPATNNATISYSLNKSGNVSIVITDLMGRVVMNMEQGNQTAGVAYTVDVNTANLANGTYFYTLTVNGERETKKFVVSK